MWQLWLAGNILWLKWTFPHIPLEPAAPPRDKFWILQEARNFKHAVHIGAADVRRLHLICDLACSCQRVPSSTGRP
jgi:hypothetical protein